MKRFFTLLMIACVATAVNAQTYWSANAAEAFDDGNGESETPYEINTPAQLAYLAKQVNEGKEKYTGKYFILTENLDLSAHYWVPIGDSDSKTFQGHFDGNGKSISGLKIGTDGSATYKDTGLFGYLYAETVEDKVSIKDLVLSADNDSAIQGKDENYSSAGALIGTAHYSLNSIGLEVSNCVNHIPVTGGNYTGGLIGYGRTNGSLTLKKCINRGEITVGASSYAKTGGIIGWASRNISYENASLTLEECENWGDITTGKESTDFDVVGGLVGECRSAKLINCQSTAIITTSFTHAGGIAGSLNISTNKYNHTASIINCQAKGEINGTATYVGGIVGELRLSDSSIPTVSGCTVDMTRLEGDNVHRVAGILNKSGKPNPDADFFQPDGNYARVAEPAEGQVWIPDLYGMDGINETEMKADPTYHTLTLEVAPGIDLYNLSAGSHSVEDGSHLYLQFLPDDRSLTAADILFLIDGVETSFKDFGAGLYYSYIFNPVHADHSILIALREYTVTLPETEGAIITPAAGIYPVAYGSPFSFSFVAAEGYDTAGAQIYVNAIELLPDLAGNYTIEQMTGPVTIGIKGIDTGGTTGIEKLNSGLSLYSAEGSLIIETTMPQTLRIYDVTGTLLVTRTISGRDTLVLPAGIYIVKTIGQTFKAVVR